MVDGLMPCGRWPHDRLHRMISEAGCRPKEAMATWSSSMLAPELDQKPSSLPSKKEDTGCVGFQLYDSPTSAPAGQHQCGRPYGVFLASSQAHV